MNSMKKAANDTAAARKIERAVLCFIKNLRLLAENLQLFVRFDEVFALFASLYRPRLTILQRQHLRIPLAADGPKTVKQQLMSD